MPRLVLDRLVASKLVFLGDIQQIDAEVTTYAKNVHMYKVVLSRVENKMGQEAVKEAICHGLCMSSQYCPFKPDQQPASTAQHEELCRLRNKLIDVMDVNLVLDKLVREGLADTYMQEHVGLGRTTRDRVDILLKFICHTHRQAHDTFMKIIRETCFGEVASH